MDMCVAEIVASMTGGGPFDAGLQRGGTTRRRESSTRVGAGIALVVSIAAGVITAVLAAAVMVAVSQPLTVQAGFPVDATNLASSLTGATVEPTIGTPVDAVTAPAGDCATVRLGGGGCIALPKHAWLAGDSGVLTGVVTSAEGEIAQEDSGLARLLPLGDKGFVWWAVPRYRRHARFFSAPVGGSECQSRVTSSLGVGEICSCTSVRCGAAFT